MKDLKITKNDLAFDSHHEFAYLQDQHAIAQDLSHRLREAGLTEQMIGAHNFQDIFRKIQLELEKDPRVSVGQVRIVPIADHIADVQKIQITAKLTDGTKVTI